MCLERLSYKSHSSLSIFLRSLYMESESSVLWLSQFSLSKLVYYRSTVLTLGGSIYDTFVRGGRCP